MEIEEGTKNRCAANIPKKGNVGGFLWAYMELTSYLCPDQPL